MHACPSLLPPQAIVLLRVLRHTLNSSLPVELYWHGPNEMDDDSLDALKEEFGPLEGCERRFGLCRCLLLFLGEGGGEGISAPPRWRPASPLAQRAAARGWVRPKRSAGRCRDVSGSVFQGP